MLTQLLPSHRWLLFIGPTSHEAMNVIAGYQTCHVVMFIISMFFPSLIKQLLVSISLA